MCKLASFCGSIAVFCALLLPTVFSWSSIIASDLTVLGIAHHFIGRWNKLGKREIAWFMAMIRAMLKKISTHLWTRELTKQSKDSPKATWWLG